MEEERKEVWYKHPLKVYPTRVRRTYRGGKNLDFWHGVQSGSDGDMPEEWLASVTEAINPGFPLIEKEGLSAIAVAEYFGAEKQQILLRDLIAQEPEALLGREHYRKYKS